MMSSVALTAPTTSMLFFFFFDAEDGCSLASTALHDGDNTVGRRC